MTAIADAADSSTVEQLIATVTELQKTVKQQADRIDQLETELESRPKLLDKSDEGRLPETWIEYPDGRQQPVGKLIDSNNEKTRKLETRIADIEHRESDVDLAPADPDGSDNPDGGQTPLERICALPEHIADRELTANQERARFIAKDVRDYAEKAPAGLVIDSRTIKKVIAAAEGKRPHTQTVARVMNFLDDLGKEDIQLKKRRGTKLIVIDPEAADRCAAHHDRCDQGSGASSSRGVIQTG